MLKFFRVYRLHRDNRAWRSWALKKAWESLWQKPSAPKSESKYLRVSFTLPRFVAFWVFYFRRLGDAWFNAKCDLADHAGLPVTCSLCSAAGGCGGCDDPNYSHCIKERPTD